MARPIGLHPKILRAFDDPDAEQLLPKTIYKYSCRQRMFPIREPAHQGQAVHWHVAGYCREGGHQSRLNLVAGRIVLPALEDERLAWFVVTHDHHKRVLRLQSTDLSFAPVCIFGGCLDLLFALFEFTVFVAYPRLGTPSQIIDEPLLIEIVEQGEQLIKLALTDRVILVIVTAGTAQCEAHPDRAHCLHTIDDVLSAPFLIESPALGVDAMVTIEPGRKHLALGGVRQQVASKLLHGELIVRHVVVERLNHPVAPRPLAVFEIVVVAVTVPVPRAVEPPDGHPFAKTRRLQQPVDHPPVGTGGIIIQKSIHLERRGRQPGQINRHPSHQRFTRSRSLWCQTRLGHSFEDEAIYLGVPPIAGLWQNRFCRRLKRPMLLVNRTLCDPLA